MPRARHPCSTPGCPELLPAGQGRCAEHASQAEQRRGTAAQRGYGHAHRTRFRRAVLARDPICVLCQRHPSVVADHYPRGRRELVAAGDDPHDPRYGRGLCRGCDPRQTARRQPGGWAREQR